MVKPKIAYDKNKGLHYIVRIVPKERIESNCFITTSDNLSALLNVRSQGQLLDAVDNLPPLVPLEKLSKFKRIFSIEEVLDGTFEYSFVECQPEELAYEFYIDSPTEIRANNGRLKSFIGDYGTNQETIKKELSYVNRDTCVFIVEPVHDWVFFRNMISISARLIGLIQSECENPLVEAGFKPSYSKIIKEDMYIIPLKGNTYYTKVKMSKDSLYLRYGGCADKSPLFFSMTTPDRIEVNNPFRIFDLHYVSKDKSVFVATTPQATGEYGKLVKKWDVTHDKTFMYLCVKSNGNQVEMAKNILVSFEEMFRNYVVNQNEKTINLGCEYDVTGIWDNLSFPRILCYSFVSSAWYALAYQRGKRIAVCEYCGNASISSERGLARNYCSASCRVRDARRRKEANSMLASSNEDG